MPPKRPAIIRSCQRLWRSCNQALLSWWTPGSPPAGRFCHPWQRSNAPLYRPDGSHLYGRSPRTVPRAAARGWSDAADEGLPSGGASAIPGWELLTDERVLVGTKRRGGPLLARRLHWREHPTPTSTPPAPRERVLWTNHCSSLSPARLFAIDRYRWRIEVQFRWLKSELGLDHLPTQDQHGVQVFFLLVVLTWLCLRLFSAHELGVPLADFSCRDARLSWKITGEQVCLRRLLQRRCREPD